MPRVNKDFESAKEVVVSVTDITSLNQLIYAIWASQLHPIHPLPGFVPSIKKDTMLILGSNPSFNADGYSRQLSMSEYPDIRELAHPKPFEAFMFQREAGPVIEEGVVLKIIDRACRMDKSIGINGHEYVKRLSKFGIEPTGLTIDEVNWWDMCCLRVNDQSQLDLFLSDKPKLKWIMLLIALRVITMQEPRMILLPNSGAAGNLKSVLKLAGGTLEFSEEYGTHILAFENVRCPIFLSANLHSRGQLDAYSKERFRWQVGWVWDKLSANWIK